MKSFNSTELKVGDRVQDKIGDVKKVVEVFENTFVLGGDKFGEYIFSYKIAIEQGWTILDSKPENETVEITFSNKNIGTITYEQMQKNINTNIIANNNELIEEIVNVCVFLYFESVLTTYVREQPTCFAIAERVLFGYASWIEMIFSVIFDI